MLSNILQRKIPGFEDISVNIFLMRRYAQKHVLDPVLYMGSFPHPMQYFAAAGENGDIVIAVINFY